MNFVKKNFSYLLLAIISILPILALFNPGLPLTHDGQDHVARIANFYQSLSEGNIVPRWAGNLNWGYGHPVMMFLYPLSSYSASLFHFLGFPLVESVKIVFGLAFVLSGVFMYKWLREFLGEFPALLGAVVYMFAPYRFVDLYVRGAIGEHLAFVFPPLICFFLLKIAKHTKFNNIYFAGAAISLGCLVLAHNAITIMFLPLLIAYAAYLVFNSKKRLGLSLNYAGILFLGLGLSSFFLVPAYFEGKFTLRDIVTGSEVFGRFVRPEQLIYGPWSYGGTGNFSLQIGVLGWLSILASPFVLYILFKKDRKLFTFFIMTLAFLLVSLFIMLEFSAPVWRIFTTLQKFQFPWRFLSITVFTSAVLFGVAVNVVNKKFHAVILLSVLLFLFFFGRNQWVPRDYLQKPEAFFSGVYDGTTDTGESAPIWSVRFMEKRPKTYAEVIQGEGEIKLISRNSTHHKYEVVTEHGFRMRENTLYFPGWKVYVDGKEYKGVQFQDPENRGLMTFFILSGKHTVDVIFENTKLRSVSNFISALSLTAILFLLIYPRFKKR